MTTPTTLDLDLQNVALGDITPYWNNPRHSEAAVEAVGESIQRYGFTVPILLDGDGVIIAGHTRYKAAQRLGMAEVPAIIRDDLTPEQVRALRIADNKAGEIASWDVDKLIQELRTLDDPSDMQPFFVGVDLDDLLAETSGPGPAGGGGVTDERIKEREEARDRTFAERSEQAGAALVEVLCPECGEEFHVNRDDILRRSQPTGDFEAMEVILPTEVSSVWEAAVEKVRERLAEDGITPHQDPGVFRGQVLEALAAEFLAGP